MTISKMVGTCVIALIFCAAVPAAAATLTPNSCSYSDVSAAVQTAAAGDTISVPAGNCSWSSSLSISKAITLQGAGIGKTFIVNNASTSLIAITESVAGNILVRGFDFSVGTGGSFFIDVFFLTNGKPVLINANNFTLQANGNALRFQTNRGVIWANTFTGTPVGSNCLDNASALRHKPSGLPWSTPATFGNTDINGDLNLYFEANTLTDVLEAIDVDDNGRAVVRYNTFTNSAVVSHGDDTSAFGGRYYEAYNNTFVLDTSPKCSGLPTNVNGFISLRGGTALIHDNVIPTPSSPTWGNKGSVVFYVFMLRRNAGPYPCWGTSTPGSYPAPRQSGWGYTRGGTVAGQALQDLEPIYLWNNTGTGNYNEPAVLDYFPNECGSAAPSASNYVQPNREYYTSTAKPGYTPYTYPHPLTGATPSSPPAPSSQPAAAAPAAPSGLTVK
jgi:hypothetical protein